MKMIKNPEVVISESKGGYTGFNRSRIYANQTGTPPQDTTPPTNKSLDVGAIAQAGATSLAAILAMIQALKEQKTGGQISQSDYELQKQLLEAELARAEAKKKTRTMIIVGSVIGVAAIAGVLLYLKYNNNL